MEDLKVLNKKTLFLIPFAFLIVVISKLTYAYYNMNEKVTDFITKEASVLNKYFMINRIHYQKLFINKTITLGEKSLSALPAFSAYSISKEFSKNNPLKITIQTVSDRARIQTTWLIDMN
jgi:hypothetical protein